MGYHDRRIHGYMKQLTIVTEGLDNKDQHDSKVTEFNSSHEVWFNSSDCKIVPVGNSARVLWVTFCLYTDLKKEQLR
jgi:hypothetical protein